MLLLSSNQLCRLFPDIATFENEIRMVVHVNTHKWTSKFFMFPYLQSIHEAEHSWLYTRSVNVFAPRSDNAMRPVHTQANKVIRCSRDSGLSLAPSISRSQPLKAKLRRQSKRKKHPRVKNSKSWMLVRMIAV